MRSITTTTLFCMEVINLCDGARLGTTRALELDADCGNVTALIVPVECGFFSFGKCDAYRIPWCRIECMGRIPCWSSSVLQNCPRASSSRAKNDR